MTKLLFKVGEPVVFRGTNAVVAERWTKKVSVEDQTDPLADRSVTASSTAERQVDGPNMYGVKLEGSTLVVEAEERELTSRVLEAPPTVRDLMVPVTAVRARAALPEAPTSAPKIAEFPAELAGVRWLYDTASRQSLGPATDDEIKELEAGRQVTRVVVSGRKVVCYEAPAPRAPWMPRASTKTGGSRGA